MRSTTPLLAAGLALAVASQALAQGAGAPTSPGGAASPSMTSQPPMTSQPSDANPSPSSKSAPPATATQPDQSAAPSANGSGAPASATAAGGAAAAAAPSFTVGETVKDNTGAQIGTISSLTGSGTAQMAVIKMGDQSFQVQANRLGSADGAAEINMTKAQIAGMLKK
jgi:hypothetical protein